MRTTISLPDDVYHIAKSVAAVEGVSLGEALGRLVRKGLKPSSPVDTGKAFPCFSISPEAKPITLEQTLRAEDEL